VPGFRPVQDFSCFSFFGDGVCEGCAFQRLACHVALATGATCCWVVLWLTVYVSCCAADLFVVVSPQVAIRVLAQGLRPLIPPYEELPPNTSRICEPPNCACLCVSLIFIIIGSVKLACACLNSY
jgi:hypothetical protein